MELYHKLDLALTRCGYPALDGVAGYQQIGSGAWHDAYLVQPPGTMPLVVRLRKAVIYGRSEQWDAQALHEDYAPVGLYYREANRCWPGICPGVYHYRIDPDLIFTLESYVPGAPLPLPNLSSEAASKIGASLAKFFRQMHERPAPLPGNGLVTWNGAQVSAASQQPWAAVWQARREKARRQLATLTGSSLEFDRDHLRQKLAEVLNGRHHAGEPAVLVNRNITPENLLVRDNTWVGLVDPVPLLDNGTYYAAWFTHCYRLFLPALSDAPRYRHHHFKDHAMTLNAVADGFETGYCQDDSALKQAMAWDEFLWALDLAYESYELVRQGMTPEMRLRRGDEPRVAATLTRSLRILEADKM